MASSSSVEPSQRAQRGGPSERSVGLRYVLIPGENPAPARRSDRPSRRGTFQKVGSWFSAVGVPAPAAGSLENAVMPLDVLGRTRVTLTEPASISLAGRPG